MTEKFTISNYFGEGEKGIISKALMKSKLPEGVSVVAWNQIDSAQKPFVVITSVPRWKDARKAAENGARAYVRFSIDPDDLVEELDKYC